MREFSARFAVGEMGWAWGVSRVEFLRRMLEGRGTASCVHWAERGLPESGEFMGVGIRVLAIVLVLLGAVAVGAETPVTAWRSQDVLMLERPYSDYLDRIRSLPSPLHLGGKVITNIEGLRAIQNVGRDRTIAASEDGRFYVVCEPRRLAAYDTDSGEMLWSVDRRRFVSTAVVQDTVYAFGNHMMPEGYLHILDCNGEGGGIGWLSNRRYDMVVDSKNEFLWIAGSQIEKYDLTLRKMVKCAPFPIKINGAVVSIDSSTDGSVWAAQRRGVDAKGKNRLIKISGSGTTVKAVDLGENVIPLCVRVDSSDGSLWVSAIQVRKLAVWRPIRQWPPLWSEKDAYVGPRTYKYSAQGKRLLTLKCGGGSLAVNSSDGSVWISDKAGLLHYSRVGRKLKEYVVGASGPK